MLMDRAYLETDGKKLVFDKFVEVKKNLNLAIESFHSSLAGYAKSV